jgi:hypothetical protein
MTDGYETDFHRWAETQAGLLRTRSANELDWDNLAEEIESLGRNDQRDLRNRIQTVLEHLIRLQASPASTPRHGWQRTLIEQRDQIEVLLEDSPSLRPKVAGIIAARLPKARQLATLALKEHGEAPRMPLDSLDYTEEQVLGPWLPEAT